jgi:hypothetical protein
LSTAAFTVVASSTVLVSVASSDSAAAAKTSLAVKVDLLPPDTSGTINAATLESGCGAMAAPGTCCPDSRGPLTVDPPLWNCNILLYRDTSSSSDDTSISLSMI